MPDGETRSLLEILTSAWESSGKKPPQLEIPIEPAGMGYLISLYWECKRSSDPIKWSELESWMRLTGAHLEQSEMHALMRLDDAHSRVANSRVSESEKNSALKHEVKSRLRAALRAAGK